MDEITERVYALTEAMKENRDYQRYLFLEAELQKNRELKKQVDEFRLRNYYLQESDVDLYEAVDEVDREFQELQKLSLIHILTGRSRRSWTWPGWWRVTAGRSVCMW